MICRAARVSSLSARSVAMVAVAKCPSSDYWKAKLNHRALSCLVTHKSLQAGGAPWGWSSIPLAFPAAAAVVSLLALPALSLCEGPTGADAEEPPAIGLDVVCHILEETNNNLDLLIPQLIHRLKLEDAKEETINTAFQDLVMKIQDSVCRNEYVPIETLQSSIMCLILNEAQLETEELRRFRLAMQRLQNFRLTALQSLVSSRKQGATREIALHDCMDILEATFEGMNRAIEDSYKEASEKGFEGEEKKTYATMRYNEKMKIVNDEIQSQFDVTGPAVDEAFRRFAAEPSFQEKLQFLLQEQGARFENAMRP